MRRRQKHSESTTDAGQVALVESERPAGRRGHPVIRRLIGVVLLGAIAYGIYYGLFVSNVLDPVWAYATPIKKGIDWVAEDPMRLVTSFAIIAIPHLGAYEYFFGRR